MCAAPRCPRSSPRRWTSTPGAGGAGTRAASLSPGPGDRHHGLRPGLRLQSCPLSEWTALHAAELRCRPGEAGGDSVSAKATAAGTCRMGSLDQMLENAGVPDDIAYPILFLSCDASRYMSGETFAVSGGQYGLGGWVD